MTDETIKPNIELVPVNLTLNDQARTIMVEPRRTLLDALCEDLGLTGTNKSCDRGECGACTVHVDGRRILSCMTLAIMQESKLITTIEGYVGRRCDRGGESRLAERCYSRSARVFHAGRPVDREGNSGQRRIW
jgi:ferredoxin